MISPGQTTNRWAERWKPRRPSLPRLAAVLGMLVGMLTPLVQVAPAAAASVTGASFSGGAGTVTVGGTLYARQGAALTLTVTTDSSTSCVRVTDGTTTIEKDATSPRTTWTFTSADSAALFVAGSGDGVKSVTATAFKNSNAQHRCTANQKEEFGTQTASYTLDNTGPVVTGAVSPAPNGAGWNNGDVTITWSATDAGSGVASLTPTTDSVTAETTGVTRTATATDRLGNSGTGSLTVKLDKSAPTIAGARSPAANSYGWNNTDVTVSFTCSDAVSGIKSCTGSTTLSAEGAGQQVTGTAVDNADNSASATVGGVNIDKTAPTLSGAPTTSPNANGWYSGDVTIRWTASDSLSGFATLPADSTITGEGTGLTATTTVSDRAGNSASATSPAVNIDRTPPATGASAPSGWTNADVPVTLSASDNLSGVAATYYRLDGGAPQTGTSLTVSGEGVHTLEYWSVDRAGNAEAPHSATVRIDQTAPTISHTLAPAPNPAGWNHTDVTVTFTCADSLSGVASCTPPQTVTSEGTTTVSGQAVDGAGNTATDTATVNLDKTAPTISGAPDRAPNAHGWYDADVTVGFTCTDGTSGVKTCSGATTLGEGAGQQVTGTAVDNADNAATATVGGINVDETAPSLSGEITTPQSADGWYNTDVTVRWTCADALSGLDGTCPADTVITGEGDNLSASASVSDKAGNAANATVSGINIDRHAPSTSASLPAVPATGWYTQPVAVTLSATDGISGIAATFYRVDGGAVQTYAGPFTVDGGVHTVTFWSVDHAGNAEDASAPGHTLEIKVDNVAPRISGSRAPAANAFGWNNSDVTVTFDCADDESGIKSCLGGTTVTTEGENQSVTGTAVDNADNSATATVGGISIDKTAPDLSGAPTTDPNANGWYRGDVTIHWTASDGLSGVDPSTVPADSTIAGEGTGLTASASVSDKAGNSASATSPAVNIDRHAPTISGAPDGPANANGWYNRDVTVSFTCADPAPEGVNASSGVASCPEPTTLGEGEGQSVTRAAIDNADNSASTTVGPINVDETAPTLAGSPDRPANADGWYNAPVTITWACADALSGIDGACPADSVLSDQGSTLSASASVSAKAGNTTSASVTGINIDLVAPSTSANAPSAWTNQGVTVDLSASDNLSGVAATYYRLDGADPVAGTAVSIATEGVHTLAYWSVDRAGNAEAPHSATVRIDQTAPTISHTLAPAPNPAGWNRADVTVTFTCADSLSGVASCTPPQTVTSEGTTTVSGQAVDGAGNTATDTATVNLDKTAPTISGAPDRAPNAHGWYDADVTVGFTCTDALSGVASCSTPTTLGEGADQSVTGTAVDVAGNSASATVGGINVDETAPTIGGYATTGPNPDGWYSGDVTIRWTCADALSGIDGTCPADTVITGEGDNLSASASVSDKAGNAASATLGGIKIDRHAPATTSDTPSGWQTHGVTIHLSATDNLSGVKATWYRLDGGAPQAYSSAGIAIASDGTHTLSFWSDDVAGNTELAQSVTVQIDQTPPTITGTVTSSPNANGWYNGPVTVEFACGDATSGVATCPASVTLAIEGTDQSVTGVATDVAGNSASTTVGGIDIDLTPPTTADDAPAGWVNHDVVVHLTASDGLSGVAGTFYAVDGGSPQSGTAVALGEGIHAVSYWSVDKADNVETARTVTVKVDKTAPTTAASVPQPDGANGWYKTRPAVTLSASDALSGIATTYYSLDGGAAQAYAQPVVVGDGIHTLAYWSVDAAGNVETSHSLTLQIDTQGPAITIGGVTGGATYTLGAVPTPSCAATDGGSGLVGGCSGTLTGGTPNGVGTYTYTATATDAAGNTTTVSVTYRVIYRWDGFLQPINDTAHQVGTTTSIFKAGSTVPVKFQLKRADGTVVQANTLPLWLTPAKGSPTTAPADESVYSDPATSGSTYRWDSAAQQYIYNWSTKGAASGYYYRIGVALDDGQTYYVNIGLR